MAKCKLLLYHPNYTGLKIMHVASNSLRVLYKLMVNSHDQL